MLVLTRKIGEKVRIGEDIVVQVLEIKGKAIRVGVDAPVHVPVLREELESIAGAIVVNRLLPCKRR